ncbi:MAG TPA: alpha/beta hydrolase [Tepidisphaeraceae bacterium]|nr:alpha/beta hydrolase [Tepidisphaeraceae bacterium]
MLSVWLTFLVLMLVMLAVLWAGVVFGMARMLLKPPRMTDGKAVYVLKRLSPGDLGLPFEEVSFVVRDAWDGEPLKIAGWWIPPRAASGKCAVLLHGYGDAKVGAIAWAPTFHALGYGVLAIDLRAHGESGGIYSTAGFWERHDVGEVINQFRASRPEETQSVILFGVSLGAAVAAATAAQRDDIDAVILDSPFADYQSAIAAHAEILGQPAGVLQTMGVRLAEWLSGANFDSVRPVDLIPKIPCPLLIVQPGNDPFVPPADAQPIEAAAASRPAQLQTVYWHVPNAPHVQALSADPAGYSQKLEEFLESPVGATLLPSPGTQGEEATTITSSPASRQ